MEKKYDLIVIGGGPGGLMAAKTAAKDGLKVLVVERKKNMTKINRACSQIFFINKLSPSGESERGESHKDAYIEPVSIEILSDKSRLHFPALDFSVDYRGPLRPYYDWIQISPIGYQIHRYESNGTIWGFCYDKEVFLAGLLTSVEKAGVEVWSETTCIRAENTSDVVKVRIKRKSKEETLEAKKAVAADGTNSRVLDSLGLNKKRQALTPIIKCLIYEMEGIETNLPQFSWLSWAVPSINTFSNIFIGLLRKDAYQFGTTSVGTLSPSTILEKFMKHERYAHMFRHARIVKKMADVNAMRAPIKEPVVGNVVFVGDAGGPGDTWIQGALACGYQAVKAIQREYNGHKGYHEYTRWWKSAFAWNNPDFFKMFAGAYSVTNICSDNEVDYIYRLFQDRVGPTSLVVGKNLELIKVKNPKLYEKLIESKKGKKVD
jgi:flavin-dependent dehydrogenase